MGRYELHHVLAEGGMARLYLGVATGAAGFTRPVAIKRLHPDFARDREFVAMLTDEARLTSAIRHRNIVSVLDVAEEKGELFLVMEYVLGLTLAELLKASEGRPVPVPVAVAVLVDLLEGLHAAHEATGPLGPLEIVHRDVTPQNVMVATDGVTRVLDFGIAKAASRAQTTRDGVVKGKTAYLAPEQIRSEPVDRRVDVYAAGVVAWELLAGRRLFLRATPDETVAAIVVGEPLALESVRPDVGAAIAAAVHRALSKNPAERFPTARAFVHALEAASPAAPAREVAGWVTGLAGARCGELSELLRSVERGHLAVKLPTPAVLEPTAALATPVAPAPPSATRSGSFAVLAAVLVVGALAGAFALRPRALEPSGATPLVVQPPPAPTEPPLAESTVVKDAPPSESTVLNPPAPALAVEAPPTERAIEKASPARPARPAAKIKVRTVVAPAAPDCDPPFVIGPDGVKSFKRECVR